MLQLKSEIYCGNEIQEKEYKLSFRYLDLEAVSFWIKKSVILNYDVVKSKDGW
jgi:hypothetical protein